VRRATVVLASIALFASAAVASPGLSVTGVDDKDTLSLHAAPDAKSAKTGALPPHETGIEIVGVDPKGVDWLKVRKGKISGWANAHFLHYDQGMPVRMTCSGSEPGFVLEVGYGKATFLFNEKPETIALDDPKTPAVTYSPWLLAVHGKPGLFVLGAMPEDACHSDSDEDAEHSDTPYSVVVNVSGVFASGCCK
jgi:hypothetical protein